MAWIKMEVARCGEMNLNVGLRVCIEGDGDITLVVEEDGEVLRLQDGKYARVEFCSTSGGGGTSPKVRDALRALMRAMEEDNMESPQGDRTDRSSYPRNKDKQ